MSKMRYQIRIVLMFAVADAVSGECVQRDDAGHILCLH